MIAMVGAVSTCFFSKGAIRAGASEAKEGLIGAMGRTARKRATSNKPAAGRA
jgi:hypothetical protein